MGIKFIKPIKETEAPKMDKPSPSPIAQEGVKRDGVPKVIPMTKVSDGGEEVKRPLGIPVDVSPSSILGDEIEDKPRESDEPETVAPTSPPPTKRRGRPPGSGKGKAKKTTSTDSISALARQIEGIHAMADIIIPGMRISHAEAQLMAEAMQDVIDAYGITVNDKVTSLLTLAGVVGIVEMPKIPIVLKWLEQKRRPKQAIQQARQMRNNVIPMDSPVVPQRELKIAEEKSSGIFAHISNEIAEGSPNG